MEAELLTARLRRAVAAMWDTHDAAHDAGLRADLMAKIEELEVAHDLVNGCSGVLILEKWGQAMVERFTADIKAGDTLRRPAARRAAWQLVLSNIEDVRRAS